MESIRYTVGQEVSSPEASASESQDELNRELVERAVAGDIEAFGELYGIYLDKIYRYVFYQVSDRTTAEDLTEEIFLKAWKGIHKFTWKGQPFSSWLYRIAHNHVVDYYKTSKQMHFLEGEFEAEDDTPEQIVEGEITRQELLDAISFLPHQQQQVIILKFIEGLENNEIEKIMGKSQGAIRVMQMRALATLRQRLNGEVHDEG